MLSENKNPYLAKDNKKLPQDVIEEKIWSHIELLTSREFCRNFDRVGFFTKCSCISSNFFGDHETPKILLLFKLLKQYESKSETSRQIILHGIITNANIRRTTRNRGDIHSHHTHFPASGMIEIMTVMPIPIEKTYVSV